MHASWTLLLLAIVCLEVVAQNHHGDQSTTLTGAASCVRLLSSEGAVGCSTAASGSNMAPLWPITTKAELDGFIKATEDDSDSVIAGPLTIVLTAGLLSQETLDAITLTGRLNGGGIMVLSVPKTFAGGGGWSPDARSPQRPLTLHPDSTFEWNPQGNGLAQMSFPFPMTVLNSTDSTLVLERALANQQAVAGGRSSSYVWSAEFLTFMHGIGDASTCFRRGHCMPMGGYSVWAALGDGSVDKEKENVILTAVMDTTALFHDRAIGGDADVSGLVAVLTAAQSLAGMPTTNITALPRQLILAAFTAEAWGFAGSRRFVKEISEDFECIEPGDVETEGLACKKPWRRSLEFENIGPLGRQAAVIEVNQVSQQDEDMLYTHFERGHVASSALASTVGDAAAAAKLNVGTASSSTPGLPPTSAQTFVQAANAAGLDDLAAVVLAGYSGPFNNKFYHSRFDDGLAWNITASDPNAFAVMNSAVCRAATTLALSAWAAAGGNVSAEVVSTLSANCNTTAALLDCLLGTKWPTPETRACWNLPGQLGVTYTTDVLGGRMPNHYSSVFNWGVLATPWFVHAFLSMTLGLDAGECSAGCTKGFECIAEHCIKAPTVNYHDAYSVGIDYDYTMGRFFIVDETQPNWAESNWGSDFGVRLLLQSVNFGQVENGLTLLWGALVVLATYFFAWRGRIAYLKWEKSA